MPPPNENDDGLLLCPVCRVWRAATYMRTRGGEPPSFRISCVCGYDSGWREKVIDCLLIWWDHMARRPV